MPLIEVVANSTKTEKPGWAYVPDTGFDPTKAPIQQPTSRKRKARVQDQNEAGLSARQNSALQKRLADLDRDNSRDLAVPVPVRSDGKRSKPKTVATRKIIEAQRTFAHYLADEQALTANENETVATKSRIGARKSSTMPPQNIARGDSIAVDGGVATAPSSSPRPSLASRRQTLEEFEAPLMRVNVPAAPSARLMDVLTSAPPLSWNDACARPSASGIPRRHFCEICGYWARVKCLQCGARVCGLVCKRTHDDGRCQTYVT